MPKLKHKERDLQLLRHPRTNRKLAFWTNPADSFMEGDPNLVTAYALLALAYAQPKA